MEQRWQIQRVFSVRKTTVPAKTSVLLYLVNIVICARNFKHGWTDNQLKKPGEQEPKNVFYQMGLDIAGKKGLVWRRRDLRGKEAGGGVEGNL